jgi:hypothetical protein
MTAGISRKAEMVRDMTIAYYALLGKADIAASLLSGAPAAVRTGFEDRLEEFKRRLDSICGPGFSTGLGETLADGNVQALESELLRPELEELLYRFTELGARALVGDQLQRREIMKGIAGSARFGVRFLCAFGLVHGGLETPDENLSEGEIRLLCASAKRGPGESRYRCEILPLKGHSVSILENKDGSHSFIFRATNGDYLDKAISVSISNPGDSEPFVLRRECREKIDIFRITCGYPIELNSKIAYKIEKR